MRYLASGKFIFLCFFILYASIGYCFAYVLEIYHNDAMARTALAFFTVYGRDPHLAAIGFVWQPLPSLLQIPFIQLLKPLNLMFLAAPLVTSICGALSVAMIYKTGQLLFHPRKIYSTLLITLLFGLNPLIILYSALGTSEMIFLICILFSSFFLIRYYYSHDQLNLLLAGFAISLSFWSRYEAIPAFIGSMIVLFLNSKVLKGTYGRLESTLLQFGLPFLYSILLWIFVNWLIMKDPFYFLSSPYSNAAYTSIFRSGIGVLENSYFSAFNSISYVVNRALFLAPVIWLLPVLGIPVKQTSPRLKNLLLLTFLTFPFIAILLFHSYQLFKGESFGWLRFFIYAIPLGTFFAFYLARRHVITGVLAIALMTVGIYTSWYAMNDGRIGSEENTFTRKLTNPEITLDFSRTFLDQKQVASFMDTQQGLILIDSGEGFGIPMFSKHPDRFVITSDTDYKEIVKDYPAKVDWIIIHKPKPENPTQNLIFQTYPGIWEGSAPAITLNSQIEEWKIFKVNRNSAN